MAVRNRDYVHFFVTAVSPVLFMDQFSEAKGQVVSNKENDRENIEKFINDMESFFFFERG